MIFMYKVFRTLVMLLCLIILSSNAAFATPEGMQALNQALSNSAQTDKRPFKTIITCSAPLFSGNVNFDIAFKPKNGMKIMGSCDYTVLGENVSIPFYADTKKKDLICYYQSEGKWIKYVYSDFSNDIVNGLTLPIMKLVENEFNIIKDAEILGNTDSQLTLLLYVDNNKLANAINVNDNFSNNKNKQNESIALNYFKQGLQNCTISCTWFVDKSNGFTNTFEIDLTDLVKATAKAAYDDTNNTLMDAQTREILGIVANYSVLKANVTYVDVNGDFEIPSDVVKSAKKAKPSKK